MFYFFYANNNCGRAIRMPDRKETATSIKKSPGRIKGLAKREEE